MLRRIIKSIKLIKIIKNFLILILIISSLLTSFPKIPIKIQQAQAAISFVGSCEGSATNGNDVTLTLPAGIQPNDLVIVAYSIGDNDNIDFDMKVLTPGYTEVADLFANDTQDVNLGVYYKIMGATPDTSVVVDGQGGTDASVTAVCMVFRGVDTTNPMDVTPTTATGLNTMHPNPPSINFLSPGAWTVIVGASGHALNLANTSNPYTFPTGYTTNAVQRPENDISDTTIGMGYNTVPSNTEDPGVMTHSGTDSTNYAWAAVTIALRPAKPTFNQIAYRFFNNLDSTDVGTPLADQNTPAILPSPGSAFRLRILLYVGNYQLDLSGENFKLQFAQIGSDNLCDTAFSGENYVDVTTSTVIAYNDNPTPFDGAPLTANPNDPTDGTRTIVNQTYEELNNFTNSVSIIPAGQDGKWDFSLKDNGAPPGTTYCFRVVKADGSLLNTYTVIPQIKTAVSISCTISATSTSFTNLSPAEVSTSLPDITLTVTSNAGFQINVKDTGNGTNPGLYKSTSPTYLIVSNDATLVAGTDGYGIQATTTNTSININPKYNKSGNDVGGLSLTNVVLATSSTAVDNANINIKHKASASYLAPAGTYQDTITYTCTAF